MKYVNIVILILLILFLIYTLFKRENFKIKSKKKIALCFLIYEEIFHEDLWYKWLENIDKNKYNIYIHYKTDKPLKYFDKYKLNNCIDTCWGCLSIVLAQNIILKKALKDKDNKHFVWLSDSCIPIKSFNYIYNYLDVNKSYYNISPDKQVFPRCNKILNFIEKQYIKKASMCSIINKKHAKLFVKNDKNIKKWFDISVPDEIAYITLLHYNKLDSELVLTPNIAAGAIIFSQWPDMINTKNFEKSKKKKKTPYAYTYICPEELDYLIDSKSLFARKFTKGCTGLENLNNLIKN